ncbi:MAG: sulfatase-like hydrolase/transferase, partial [Planctomycetota bacterium]|nr:sulfatase-like hydrolase/transferase [Planctomycetota bacterium]
LLSALLWAPCGSLQAATAAPKPNIIFILSDDVGLGDTGCYGGPFQTPHLDALAAGGTRFEYCYSTPLCGPSRCQFLTGRYPFRTGLINNQSHNAVSPTREVMIPTVLNKAGYSTASVGKWGQIALGPGPWGFDEYLVFPGSGRYWREQTTHYQVNGRRKPLPAGTYLPDVMHEFLVEFITRRKDRPFFVYYPMSHIHGPIVPTPDSKAGASKAQLYADNIEYMDKLVGKLMGELGRLGLRKKTLVLFSGDNGTARFGADAATVNGKAISGRKATMLEGGSRVPLIAAWPDVTPAGKVRGDMIDFSDFFATVAELGGAALPAGVTLDSHSFAPQLKGRPGDPRQWVYVELNGKSYVRDRRYKLTNDGRMFDLKNAPCEEVPIPAAAADAGAQSARQRLQQILTDHPAAPAGPNPKKKANQAQTRP